MYLSHPQRLEFSLISSDLPLTDSFNVELEWHLNFFLQCSVTYRKTEMKFYVIISKFLNL